jgi:hypothetical protein
MKLFCNGDPLGEVEHVEWKEETDEGGVVTFMVGFEVDWEDKRHGFLELVDGETRYMIARIRKIDEGTAGDFVSADYKPL